MGLCTIDQISRLITLSVITLSGVHCYRFVVVNLVWIKCSEIYKVIRVLKAKYKKCFIEFERKGKLQLIKNILERNDSVKKSQNFSHQP
jgi:hypothetical protein